MHPTTDRPAKEEPKAWRERLRVVPIIGAQLLVSGALAGVATLVFVKCGARAVDANRLLTATAFSAGAGSSLALASAGGVFIMDTLLGAIFGNV